VFKFKDISVSNLALLLILVTFILPPQILNPIFIGLFLFIGFTKKIIFKRELYKRNFNQISALFIIYFLVMTFSLLYSQNLENGFGFISKSFAFLIIPLIPLVTSRKDLNLELIFKGYIYFLQIIFLFLVIVAIYKNINEGYTIEYLIKNILYDHQVEGKYEYINYWFFVYDNFTSVLKIQPIYLGLLTNIGLAFLLYLKKQQLLKYYYTQFFIITLMILLIGSRWQILIFAFNYFIFIFFFEKSKIFIKIVSVISLAIFILTISMINPVTRTRIKEAFTYNDVFYKDDFGGTSIRIKKWANALECFNENPIIGFGVGDSKERLLEQYKKNKFYLGFYNKYNAHNQYLDTLLQTGIIGFIPLIMIFIFAYKNSFNKMYLLLVTNIFLIGFLTESMLSRQSGIISFCFFLIMLSTYNFKNDEN